MPFTLSHPAAVLPLRRTGLPMAALVCGSMAPDLHMVVPGVTDEMTHRWQGVPTVDLVLGLALTAFWVLVLAPTATAAAPEPLRARLRPPPRYAARDWLLVLPGVVVGAATHVGWDTFTHQDMWGGQHVPWLYETHHGYPGFQLTQYASSIVGLVIVALWAVVVLRQRTPRPAPDHPRSRAARLALGVPIGLGLLTGLVLSVAIAGTGQTTTDFVLYAGIRSGLVITCVGGVVGAVWWRMLHGTTAGLAPGR